MKQPSNKHIATILFEIADMLEMQDIAFKPRAYRKAAQEIEEYPQNVSGIKDIKKLKDIPGIGQSIAEKILEIAETGVSEYYEQLKRKFPIDIATLNKIEGVGPKTIKQLYEELDIKTLDDLEQAAKSKKIEELEGFGKKSQENMIKGIAALKKHSGRFHLHNATEYANKLLAKLEGHNETIRVAIAGSVRRQKETIGDLDILLISKNPEKSMDYFANLETVERIIGKGKTKATVEFDNGMQADLRIIKKESWGAALLYFTGNLRHNIQLRKRAIKKGYKLSEYGLFDKDGNVIAGRTEADVYKKLGMQTPPPEIRRDCGEIEAAINNTLPTLIEQKDIKGDLQMHTNYSDGQNTPEEMVSTAQEMGYEYIAITDHNTEGLEVAGGVKNKEIPEYIKSIKKHSKNVHVLGSLEINIDTDGSLTVPEKYVTMLDFVLIAIHSQFRLSKDAMTKRILTAFENPYVHAFAHPTGRLLLKREPYDFDFEAVCKKAKEKNIALEINAYPERLDLDGEYVTKAKEYGVTFSIGTDSHATHQLSNMQYGVSMARRGWLEKKEVINTYSYSKLKKYLAQKK